MSVYEGCLSEILSLGEAERQRLSAMIETLVALNDEAREDGLLSLEERVPELSSSFLRLAVQLVVDGSEPEEVSRVLWVSRHADGFTGVEQAERILIEAGVLAILDGTNSRMLKTLLSAYLGEEAALKSTME
jgi:flagellar motor component MotA